MSLDNSITSFDRASPPLPAGLVTCMSQGAPGSSPHYEALALALGNKEEEILWVSPGFLLREVGALGKLAFPRAGTDCRL